jgi:ion channel/pentapeptide repeat protein
MRDKEGFRFDLITQRFLKGHWETPLGRMVLDRVIEGIKDEVEIRVILDDYVLEHPANSDPYGHPYYPPDAMKGKEFWVLTQDDLRGASFIGQEFIRTPSLEVKALSYASFYGCNLSQANLQRTELSYAQFEHCNLTGICFVGAGGFETKFLNCQLQDACFWRSALLEADCSGSDLRGAYFEDARLEDLIVNYQSRFDEHLASSWRTRSLPPAQRPDILRAIRIAFERQQIWNVADRFLYRERVEQRRHISWPTLRAKRDLNALATWLGEWFSAVVSGHGTKPFRVVMLGGILSVVFAWIYFWCGVPAPRGGSTEDFLKALYFSSTTFATLGYGDVTYEASRPMMRLLSSLEAWAGAIIIALFVTALARKVLR